MNIKFNKLVCFLALLPVLALTSCNLFGEPLDAEELEKIDNHIRESIEKTFPLPESVAITTHIADDLHFSTKLTVDEIVVFYRDAYAQNGFLEDAGSLVSDDMASLYFMKKGEKDVLLEVMKSETGSDVHLWLVLPRS